MKFQNAQGTIYYGLHFYPGVAEYRESDKDPFRVFLNEDTLRAMDASFAGRPVFVQHVEAVESDLNELRKEADGWVVESFFNAADGKHWCKMIVCSELGEEAIRKGYKLSNCYVPKQFGKGGLWNGISYDKEVTGGEYEHLAIVPNPRYEESIILTPEEFKEYNEQKKLELSKIANQQGVPYMGLNLWKRAKVENAIDLEATMVQLPKSKREVSLATLVNEMDEHEKKKDEPQMANDDHHVEVGGSKMKVSELKDCYNALKDEHEKMKSEKKENEELGSEGSEDPGNDDEAMENKDDDGDEDDKKSKAMAVEKEKEVSAEKKKNAAEKAERLRNASKTQFEEPDGPTTFSPFEKVNRGKAKYGS